MTRVLSIEPILGFNGLMFGASPGEVKAQTGPPLDIREPDGDKDMMSWSYSSPDLKVWFERANDWRMVSCETADPMADLAGTRIIGLTKDEGIEAMRAAGLGDILVVGEGDATRVIARGQSVDLFVKGGRVSSVSWGEPE